MRKERNDCKLKQKMFIQLNYFWFQDKYSVLNYFGSKINILY